MHSQWAALATSALVILSAVAKPLAPPTTGWLYNDRFTSLIFPLTATECEPFNIFYNLTIEDYLYIFDAARSHNLFRIYFPIGIGYLEWICNIPAGIGFDAFQNFIVQAGSSSACLGDLNTTYSYLSYSTTNFESFTRNPSPLVTSLPTNTLPTTTFPTGIYATITLNPNLAVTPTTTSPPSSSSPVTFSTSSPPSPTTPPPPMSPPSPSPTPSHKSRNAAVAGGVVGAVAFVTLIVALVLWRRRRRLFQASASSLIDPQPASISGLATGELESTGLSSPFRRSGTKLLGRMHTPDGGTAMVPMANNPAIAVPIGEGPEASPYATPLVSQRPSQGTIRPFVAEPVLPSQRPRKPRNNERQASEPSPPLDLPSRTPPTAEQQPPYTPADAAPETSRPDAVPPFQQSSTNEAQEGPLDLTAVLGVISRAQLSPMDRLTAVHNLLISDPSGQPGLARQNTVSSPPPYAE